MIYALTLTGTKSGSSSSPQVSKLKLTRGLIYKVEIHFPPGPSGLVHCYVEYEGVQIYPTQPGENFSGNNIIIDFEDTRWVNTEPFEFDVRYWNEDDTFNHNFQLRIGLVANKDLISRYVPADFLTGVKKLIAQQEAAKTNQSQSVLRKIFELFRKGE